ncbi:MULTISPECIES: MotA/TolQ/ExbB proton channel family protein [unclassified Neochlamydia]|uniref:MotA/TolQ/ExbB proton channel family protein n=1 Tax=unclassified Neochlamydia TaxID=2643326 RepID=UPI0014078245|nr:MULTISPECIES: MotA/TolQ/ExbB proton channel family protein [unclassified Neochlamydia]MBS4165197.1 Uncharacterized protein [Neochlamydia sp. AcF65]MBS4170918.1 Uncharacterized protein [Neochlamydia sp. AcF95]NGY94176.1 hypothetical protein [Neochlamydia sp. AcF84]
MNVNIFVATNPFYEAYVHSDFLGKLIFIGLIFLSIMTWIILLHKIWHTYQARKQAARFYDIFQLQKQNPLNLDCEAATRVYYSNPYMDLYSLLKKQTLEVLNKNKFFIPKNKETEQDAVFLSLTDIDFLQGSLATQVAHQIKNLEKNLFILSTVVSLAPFLGLLGTVWGILTSFSDFQVQAAGNTPQMVLGGLSLALATTVLGLIDAIPALIGYNYLKHAIRDFEIEMESFASEILGCVEMQYRKVDFS